MVTASAIRMRKSALRARGIDPDSVDQATLYNKERQKPGPPRSSNPSKTVSWVHRTGDKKEAKKKVAMFSGMFGTPQTQTQEEKEVAQARADLEKQESFHQQQLDANTMAEQRRLVAQQTRLEEAKNAGLREQTRLEEAKAASFREQAALQDQNETMEETRASHFREVQMEETRKLATPKKRGPAVIAETPGHDKTSAKKRSAKKSLFKSGYSTSDDEIAPSDDSDDKKVRPASKKTSVGSSRPIPKKRPAAKKMAVGSSDDDESKVGISRPAPKKTSVRKASVGSSRPTAKNTSVGSSDDDESKMPADPLLPYRGMDGGELKKTFTAGFLQEFLSDVPQGLPARDNRKVMELALLCYQKGAIAQGSASMKKDQLAEFQQIFWENRETYKTKKEAVDALEHLVKYHYDQEYKDAFYASKWH